MAADSIVFCAVSFADLRSIAAHANLMASKLAERSAARGRGLNNKSKQYTFNRASRRYAVGNARSALKMASAGAAIIFGAMRSTGMRINGLRDNLAR